MIRRFVWLSAFLGCVTLVVSVLAAAKQLTDSKKGPAEPVPSAATSPPAPSAVGGGVTFGHVDSPTKVREVWPRDFPQPSLVKEAKVGEGAVVKAGNVILVMDDELARLKVDEAKAAIGRYEATVRLAEQALKAQEFGVQTQQAAIESANYKLVGVKAKLDDAKDQFRRKLPGITETDIKAAEADYEAQQQALLAERRKLKAAETLTPVPKIDEAKGALAEAQSKLKQAELGVEYMKVKAPCDGLILRANASAGTTFGPQSREPAFMILPNGAPLIVRLEIDQEYAHRFEPGMVATIHHDNLSGLTWKGKIVSLGDAFLPKRPPLPGAEALNLTGTDTRVLEAIVEFDPASASQPGTKLRFGQKVRVDVAPK